MRGRYTTDVFLIFLLSLIFDYFLSFDSSFHMYLRRRENVRRKIWPKEERKVQVARTYNVSCFSFRRVRRHADEHGNEKKKVIKRNGKGDMLE
jgi:hypothetical protein